MRDRWKDHERSILWITAPAHGSTAGSGVYSWLQELINQSMISPGVIAVTRILCLFMISEFFMVTAFSSSNSFSLPAHGSTAGSGVNNYLSQRSSQELPTNGCPKDIGLEKKCKREEIGMKIKIIS